MSITPEKLKLIDYINIHKSMERDFHAAEIKPLWLILWLRMRGRYEGYACREGKEWAGYILLSADGGGHTLLDYYAIEPEYRSKGYGSSFFRAVCGLLNNLLLEVEDPAFAPDEADKANRVRRIFFYERNGCAMTPVRANVGGERYCIMTGPETRLSESEVRAAMDSLYNSIFGGKWAAGHIQMGREG